jgi:hypothetical protein
MQGYDPLAAPDPEQWLALDEQARSGLVRDYHQRARPRLPHIQAHALLHVAVENQIALGDESPAQRTARRLMDEGLDRHDAIHAIGLVLIKFMYDLIEEPGSAQNEAYFAALERLTADEWRAAR